MRKHSSFTICFLTLIFFLFYNCQHPEKAFNKQWLGKKLDFEQLQSKTDYYHIFDSAKTKVGSMVFGTFFNDGLFIARDTSQFDDGSFIETAAFRIDTTTMKTKSVFMSMSYGNTSIEIDIEKDNERITGAYSIKRDTLTNEQKMDSIYDYDIVRSEIYMLLNAIELKQGDTLKLRSFVPSGLSVSDITIFLKGKETIKVPYSGKAKECQIISIRTDGKMPNNDIWITKDRPRQMFKFFVPEQKLSIELMDIKYR